MVKARLDGLVYLGDRFDPPFSPKFTLDSLTDFWMFEWLD